MTSTAHVPTPNASRYLQQLNKHWSHKFAVEFTATESSIQLPLGEVALVASDDTLDITLSPLPDADLAKMKEVVESHVDRFAHREGALSYDWQTA